MSATCNVSNVLVGSTIRLSASGSGGSGPYQIIISNGTTVLLNNTGITESVVVYVDVVLSIVGTYNFNAYVINSCGSSSVTEQCTVTALSCLIPTCNFIVTAI